MLPPVQEKAIVPASIPMQYEWRQYYLLVYVGYYNSSLTFSCSLITFSKYSLMQPVITYPVNRLSSFSLEKFKSSNTDSHWCIRFITSNFNVPDCCNC